MRKILSFLMMALFSVSMFAATDSVYVWDGNGSTTAAIQKGGTAEAIQTSGTNIVAGASQKGNWCFKVNKGFTNGEYYIGIALEEGVNAGDEISIAYFRTGSKATYVLGMDFSADKASAATTYQILSKGDPQVLDSNGTPADSTFVVPDGVKNAKYIRIYRNSGSTGLYVSKFVIKSEAEQGGGEEEEPTSKAFYLTLSSDWAGWPAKYAIYTWKEGVGDLWVEMEKVEGGENLYTASIPLDNDKLIFVRLNGEATELNWDNKWSQTVNLDFPTGDDNHFTVTSGGTGDECNGTWSKYVAPEPEQPAEPDSIYFVNVPGWENLRVHLWGGSAAGTEWPGVEMTLLEGDDEKINDFDVYKYVADKGAYAKCIFSNNGQDQTADLAWTSGKYFYDGAWYAKENIPAPAVPLEGNIWKVTAETPVRAGSHFVDEDLIKVDGVFATALAGNARTIDGVEFANAIKVRNAEYPTAQVPEGTEQSGSTSLIVTAKEKIDITLYYNRQSPSSDGKGEENDNKDLKVFDQAAPTVALTGEFTIHEASTDNKYINVTKVVTLEKGHVYTLSAKGTTIQFHGLKFEKYVAPKFYITGNAALVGEDLTWNEKAIVSKENSYIIKDLKADTEYALKVIEDGNWQGGKVYGFDELTETADGLSADADRNICFKLAEDGDVTVTYFWQEVETDNWQLTFKLEGNFFVKQVVLKDIKLVPNQWADGDAKIAAWVWDKDGEMDSYFTDFFEPIAEGNDTLSAKINVEADSIIFVRFNATATEPKWSGGEGYQWNQTPNDGIQWEKGIFTILPGTEYYSKGTWDVYVPEVPAKFYITGEAKLVGGDGWQANDIKVTEDSYTFENLAAGDYAFKITTDGTWSTTKGYDALTAYTKGLFRGTGSGDDNIRFILKEAGNVTVTYTDEVFKVEASVEFDLPSVKIVGDLVGTWSGDEAVALTPAADGLTASLTHSLEMNDNHGYSLKMIVAGSWLSLLGEGGQSYGLHSEHTTAANIYYDDENSPALWLTITEAGNYQFIWEYATNSLTVIFPSPATAIDNAKAAGKAIKMIEHGQLFILRDGKTYSVEGLLVK